MVLSWPPARCALVLRDYRAGRVAELALDEAGKAAAVGAVDDLKNVSRWSGRRRRDRQAREMAPDPVGRLLRKYADRPMSLADAVSCAWPS